MRIRILRSEEYADFKNILNRARHPSFIGRQTFGRNAENGGAFLFGFDVGDAWVAAALLNPRKNVLLVLAVVPEARKQGMGGDIVEYLSCNFARIIETAVGFFEHNGYKRIGKAHKGIRFKTFLMVRKNLIGLAGRLGRIFPKR